MCCRKGWKGNGCDGTIGGRRNHQCVAKPEGNWPCVVNSVHNIAWVLKLKPIWCVFSFLGNLAETEPTCDDENNTGLCTDSFKWACDYCDYFQADCQKLCGQCWNYYSLKYLKSSAYFLLNLVHILSMLNCYKMFCFSFENQL